MAEGFARQLGGKFVRAASAGIEAHGPNPRAIEAMAEAGVDIRDQESTRVTPALLTEAELVVTVCGHADEHCPVLPPGIRRVHWPIPDPAKASGSEEAIRARFRAVRDHIRSRVEALLGAERTGERHDD